MTPYLWLIALSDLAVFGFALYAVIRWLAERRSFVLRSIRKLKRGGSASNSNSASPPRNTNRFLNTREDVARFVTDLRNPESGSRLTTIIRPASFVGYFASCVIGESSGREVRVYLSRRLLTLLTPQELQCLESELLRVDQRNNVGAESGGQSLHLSDDEAGGGSDD